MKTLYLGGYAGAARSRFEQTSESLRFLSRRSAVTWIAAVNCLNPVLRSRISDGIGVSLMY